MLHDNIAIYIDFDAKLKCCCGSHLLKPDSTCFCIDFSIVHNQHYILTNILEDTNQKHL